MMAPSTSVERGRHDAEAESPSSNMIEPLSPPTSSRAVLRMMSSAIVKVEIAVHRLAGVHECRQLAGTTRFDSERDALVEQEPREGSSRRSVTMTSANANSTMHPPRPTAATPPPISRRQSDR